MSYEGRSPMKDVARSVVLGAAMISPGLLEACKTDGGAPPLVPVPTATAGNDDDAAGAPLVASGGDAGGEADASPAPSATVVRPRDPVTGPTRMPMPTRGFSGGARVRG